jgi:hypothetical protein
MSILNKSVFYLVFLGLCISCTTPDSLDKPELIKYITNPDNGLFLTNEDGKFKTTIEYRPSEFFAQLEKNDSTSAEELKEIVDRYNSYLYFIVNFSYENKELLSTYVGHPMYKTVIETLAFGLREKIQLITDKGNKVELMDFSHTRQYGMGNSAQVLIIFNKEEVLSETKNSFKIKIKKIGVGPPLQHFTFKKENLLECPKLNL